MLKYEEIFKFLGPLLLKFIEVMFKTSVIRCRKHTMFPFERPKH
jgi:hypothetical protein